MQFFGTVLTNACSIHTKTMIEGKGKNQGSIRVEIAGRNTGELFDKPVTNAHFSSRATTGSKIGGRTQFPWFVVRRARELSRNFQGAIC